MSWSKNFSKNGAKHDFYNNVGKKQALNFNEKSSLG